MFTRERPRAWLPIAEQESSHCYPHENAAALTYRYRWQRRAQQRRRCVDIITCTAACMHMLV